MKAEINKNHYIFIAKINIEIKIFDRKCFEEKYLKKSLSEVGGRHISICIEKDVQQKVCNKQWNATDYLQVTFLSYIHIFLYTIIEKDSLEEENKVKIW